MIEIFFVVVLPLSLNTEGGVFWFFLLLLNEDFFSFLLFIFTSSGSLEDDDINSVLHDICIVHVLKIPHSVQTDINSLKKIKTPLRFPNYFFHV